MKYAVAVLAKSSREEWYNDTHRQAAMIGGRHDGITYIYATEYGTIFGMLCGSLSHIYVLIIVAGWYDCTSYMWYEVKYFDVPH